MKTYKILFSRRLDKLISWLRTRYMMKYYATRLPADLHGNLLRRFCVRSLSIVPVIVESEIEDSATVQCPVHHVIFVTEVIM